MHSHRPRNSQRGFTLIEMLTVLVIIGLLSSIGFVSYESVKVRARDTKRVSDVKQLQTALELFFENHSSYPSDGVPGLNGQLLGFDQTKVFSDAGFASAQQGGVYMMNVPKNPQPGGTDYVYRSLYLDGRDCHRRDHCESYAVLFTLEGTAGSLGPGEHALTPDGITGEGGAYAGQGILRGGFVVGLQSTQDLVSRYTLRAATGVRDIAQNEQVEQVARITAPAVAILALSNVALTVHATASAAALFVYLFTQPLMILSRRKYRAWGTIYNSLSKLPVDLAIVRLVDANTGQRIKTVATDHQGRFSFLVNQGTYKLDVAKAGFEHPSKYVVDVSEDGQFTNVHTAEEIRVAEEGGLLKPDIPVDPIVADDSAKVIVRKNRWKYFQQGIAVLSPTLGVLAFAIQPNILTGGLLAAQLMAYWLFKRLAMPKEPKQWGYVYERGVGKAVGKAVLRIFALPYHKLVESQVTDGRGRYHFRVGSGNFYLTASRSGYEKTESEPLNLKDSKEPTVIATNIPMQREADGSGPKADVKIKKRGLIVGPQAKIPSASEVTAPKAGNSDGSLEGLLPNGPTDGAETDK